MNGGRLACILLEVMVFCEKWFLFLQAGPRLITPKGMNLNRAHFHHCHHHHGVDRSDLSVALRTETPVPRGRRRCFCTAFPVLAKTRRNAE